MKNFTLNMPGFKEMYEKDAWLNYHLDTNSYLETEYQNEDPNYLLSMKKIEKPKKEKKRKKKIFESVVCVHRNSDAYSYYKNEFRENRISEDGYGNLLVPNVYQKRIKY